MRKLSSYIGRYWYGYVFAVASMVTAIALDMLYPKITQKIVDDVILGGQMEILTKLLTGIVLVGIGRSIFGYCKEFTFDFLSSKIGAEVRKDLFNHIQTLSMRYFDDTNTGELMARVKDDVDKIQNALGYVGMLLIEVTIHVVFVLYCMFSLNWKMAFLPVTVMLCCAVVAIIMERKLDKVYEDISEENAVLTTVAEENLAGVRTVKAFAREDYEIKKTKKEIQISYTGNGFLHNMVRILTGTLVEVGCGKIKPEDITKALESTKRSDAGITAPPQGLFLVSVEY